MLRCYIWKWNWTKLSQAECMTCSARPWEIYGNLWRLTCPPIHIPNPIGSLLVGGFKCFKHVLGSILPVDDGPICSILGWVNWLPSDARRILSVPRFSMQPSQAVVDVEDAFWDRKMSVLQCDWDPSWGRYVIPKVQRKGGYNTLTLLYPQVHADGSEWHHLTTLRRWLQGNSPQRGSVVSTISGWWSIVICQ